MYFILIVYDQLLHKRMTQNGIFTFMSSSDRIFTSFSPWQLFLVSCFMTFYVAFLCITVPLSNWSVISCNIHLSLMHFTSLFTKCFCYTCPSGVYLYAETAALHGMSHYHIICNANSLITKLKIGIGQP